VVMSVEPCRGGDELKHTCPPVLYGSNLPHDLLLNPPPAAAVAAAVIEEYCIGGLGGRLFVLLLTAGLPRPPSAAAAAAAAARAVAVQVCIWMATPCCCQAGSGPPEVRGHPAHHCPAASRERAEQEDPVSSVQPAVCSICSGGSSSGGGGGSRWWAGGCAG